jgi:predicted ABC-type ATPase
MPNLVVIAGPNGAGKSTAAPLLIGKRLGIAEFVNADVIAAELSPSDPDAVAMQAGRIMLKRLDALTATGSDFSFETTLASRHFAPWIAKLQRERGYRFHLVYLWLPDVEQNILRVAGRVRHGGHNVSPDVIRRRYANGLRNFLDLYRPIANSWALYDNSTEARLVAKCELDGSEEIHDAEAWAMIEKQSKAREQERAYQAGSKTGGIMGVPIDEVTAALRDAAHDAWRRHKALGYPIVILRDGKVVEVPPEDIEV